MGRVRTLFVGGRQCNAKPLVILNLSIARTGYAVVNLCRDLPRQSRTKYVHRLVLEAFVGKCPRGQQTRHKDGVRNNNRLSNLAWGTQKQNEADKFEHGTMPVGEQRWNAKLKKGDVVEIRNSSLGLLALSKIYGVHKQTIYEIRSGKSWRHIS